MPIKSNNPIKISSNTESKKNNELTKKEIQFLLSKMKTAQFVGAEFEQFYSIFTKLSNQLEKK
jgi:hypothetical protein